MKRPLMDKGTDRHADKARHHEKQKQLQSQLQGVQGLPYPLVRATLDPTYTKAPEGAERSAPREARALRNELDRRRKHKSAAVANLKAEHEYHLDAAASGFILRRRRVRAAPRRLRPGPLPRSGHGRGRAPARRHRRGAQMSLPADELHAEAERQEEARAQARRGGRVKRPREPGRTSGLAAWPPSGRGRGARSAAPGGDLRTVVIGARDRGASPTSPTPSTRRSSSSTRNSLRTERDPGGRTHPHDQKPEWLGDEKRPQRRMPPGYFPSHSSSRPTTTATAGRD